MVEISESRRRKLVSISVKQLKAGMAHRKPRMKQISKIEAVYDQKPQPTLRRRLNIPFDTVVVRGFVETLMSKIDDPIQGTFRHFNIKDLIAAQKIQSKWNYEADEARGDWNGVDLDAKKFGVFSNTAYYKYMASSQGGKYQSILEAPDYLDMVTEPHGGPDLDPHLFTFQINIFKSKSDLKKGVKAGIYDRDQVKELLAARNEKLRKETNDQFEERRKRDSNLGFVDKAINNYVGEDIYNLTEGRFSALGSLWYVLFDDATKIAVRLEPFKDVFKSELNPWQSWQVFRDPRGHLSLGPLDVLLPVAEIMRVIWSEFTENIRRINWNMVAVDAKMFPNLEDLQWRPDGIVRADLDAVGGRSIQQGVYEFKVPQLGNVVINLLEFLNAFVGEKTGITPGSQGRSETTKVGIHFSNLAQISERIGLQSKYYRKVHIGLLHRFHWGVKEHLGPKQEVKGLGPDGPELIELLKEDVNAEIEYGVRGANEETQADEFKATRRADALVAIGGDEELRAQVNSRWRLEEVLRLGMYTEQEIRMATDKENFANAELISKAERAIDKIVKGKDAEVVHEANTAFVQHILTFAKKNRDDLKPGVAEKLLTYSRQHMGIAEINMVRQLQSVKTEAEIAQLTGRVPAGETPKPLPADVPPEVAEENIETT